jgi:hypothetical protein
LGQFSAYSHSPIPATLPAASRRGGARRRSPPIRGIGDSILRTIAKPFDDGVRQPDSGRRLAMTVANQRVPIVAHTCNYLVAHMCEIVNDDPRETGMP